MPRSLSPLLALVVLLVLLSTEALRASPWLTFTEISYRPAGDETLEFVEIYNLEAPGVDLGGWKLEGEVEFEFPAGLRLSPRACLVVARDVEAFRKAHPDAAVVGPFRGRLGNDGGRLFLRNRVGALAAELRYGRTGAWTALADGTGHSLVLADALFDPRDPASWQPSETRGGSPGEFEQTFRRIPGTLLIRRGEPWKLLRGTEPPPAGWHRPDLDDSSWETAASGFGYGDGDDETVLEEMRGQYLSIFTRKTFEVEDPSTTGNLTLLVDFDDGFVAYLNGREVARSNVGFPGSENQEIRFDQPAVGQREAGQAQPFSLGDAKSWFRPGRNVLSVAGFNGSADSSDFSLIVELESRKVAKRSAESDLPDPVLHEVALRPNAEGSLDLEWIEIHNPASSPRELDGSFLGDDPSKPARWKIPEGTRIEADGKVVLTAEQLGVESPVGPVLFLTSPGGDELVDALSLRDVPLTSTSPRSTPPTLHVGRYPDGAARTWILARGTPGEANVLLRKSDLVIHELAYHPVHDGPSGEFLEIHNRGQESVSLEGLSLTNGVSFDFPEKTSLPAGGYLVVARDPEALARRHGLADENVVGPFRGQLSNRGEEIRLRDSLDRTLDLVTYADRDPWPRAADGGGSSLELVDPTIENSLAGAWAPSRESGKSEWTRVEYRAGVYLFGDMPATSFQFLLLNAGECLVDDLVVTDADGKVVIDEDFEGEVGRWRAFGTHLDSGILRESPLTDSPCYRIVASGRGNSRHNYVSLDLPSALTENAKYTVSFRARWISGAPLLLSRTSGQGLARTTRLPLPERTGTPGRGNSVAGKSAPVIGTPRQEPIVPRAEQAVRFVVPISSREKLSRAVIRYRHESSAEWKTAPLSPIDSLHYSGEIPSLPRGRVEFAIEAEDADGRRGQFPRAGRERPAQYAVGLDLQPGLPAYTVLVTDREWEASRDRQRMSNRLMDATLVYGRSRIFYNVGFRARGSGFTRGGGNWRLVFGAETLDGRSELTFDGQSRDSAKMNERLTFWLLDQVDVPTPRQRYVRVNLPGQPGESGVYEDVEKINGAYLARWFPAGEGSPHAGGPLHKVDDYWDFQPPEEEPETREERGRGFGGFGGFRGGFGRRNGSYVEAYLQYETSDPEDYRWNFPPRANGNSEDFEPLIELIRLMDPEKTPREEFFEKVDSAVAVDRWTRLLAGRTLTDDWDTYGLQRGKNAYLYRAPSGQWHLLPWDSDLSWASRGRGFGFGGFGRRGGDDRSLVPEKFPAVRRLLSHPGYRRQFLAHLAFLAEKRLAPEHFANVLKELEQHRGIRNSGYLEAAGINRRRILDRLPRATLEVEAVDKASPEKLRLRGQAPLLVDSLRLAGREGEVRFLDDTTWTATFEVETTEGPLVLEALDRDGDPVGRVEVKRPDS